MTLSKEEKAKRSEERKLIRYNASHRVNEFGQDEKICSICGKWKLADTEHFYPNKLNETDGLCPYCKKCHVQKSMKWIKDNPDKYQKAVEKTEARTERIEKKRNRSNEQREEGYFKEYRRNNKLKIRQYSKERGQKNHKINKKEWNACLEYFNNCCAYCGMSLEEHKLIYKKQLHKEHVIHNGADDLSNCIPSCQSCNSQKWEFSLEEWYNESNSNFTQERLDKINKWLNEDYKLYIQPHKPKGKYTKKNTEYWENKSKI